MKKIALQISHLINRMVKTKVHASSASIKGNRSGGIRDNNGGDFRKPYNWES